MAMEKHGCGFVLIFCIVISLGLASFVSCIAAEFKRTKKKDVKMDGKLCYLPGSHAFGFGMVALMCLLGAQMIGNLLICTKFCWRKKSRCRKPKKPTIAITLLIISWMSFGIAVILIGTATSMNRRQGYGEGWLDGKCYVVKDGLFIASAILVLFTIASTLASAILPIITTNTQIQQDRKVDSQTQAQA